MYTLEASLATLLKWQTMEGANGPVAFDFWPEVTNLPLMKQATVEKKPKHFSNDALSSLPTPLILYCQRLELTFLHLLTALEKNQAFAPYSPCCCIAFKNKKAKLSTGAVSTRDITKNNRRKMESRRTDSNRPAEKTQYGAL